MENTMDMNGSRWKQSTRQCPIKHGACLEDCAIALIVDGEPGWVCAFAAMGFNALDGMSPRVYAQIVGREEE